MRRTGTASMLLISQRSLRMSLRQIKAVSAPGREAVVAAICKKKFESCSKKSSRPWTSTMMTVTRQPHLPQQSTHRICFRGPTPSSTARKLSRRLRCPGKRAECLFRRTRARSGRAVPLLKCRYHLPHSTARSRSTLERCSGLR